MSTVQDGRRPPFCWQTVPALSRLRSEWGVGLAESSQKPKCSLALGRSVYLALTELANDARAHTSIGSESAGFTGTRQRIGDLAGVDRRSVDAAIAELIRLRLLKVERRRQGKVNLPNLYWLIEPGGGGESSPPPGGEIPQGSGLSPQGVVATDRTTTQEGCQEGTDPPNPPEGGVSAERRRQRVANGSKRKRDLLAVREADQAQLASQIADDPAAVAAWEQAVGVLRAGVPESTFRLWIEPLAVAGGDGDVLVLAAPEDRVRAWVEKHYRGLIAEALNDGSGYREVRFVEGREVAA